MRLAVAGRRGGATVSHQAKPPESAAGHRVEEATTALARPFHRACEQRGAHSSKVNALQATVIE